MRDREVEEGKDEEDGSRGRVQGYERPTPSNRIMDLARAMRRSVGLAAGLAGLRTKKMEPPCASATFQGRPGHSGDGVEK